ncbi:MAG TPA: hypothetical protein VNF47_24885 [Streptosporangiaceae bacterium]|nr:hypothetical protein [Streptosporangiaceae bacterium]
MTDLAQGQVVRRQGQAAPRPLGQAEPGRAAHEHAGFGRASSGRATAKAELAAALSGVELTESERRFLARLSQWDKRNASMVAALVSRARQRGQQEAALTPRQLEDPVPGFRHRAAIAS